MALDRRRFLAGLAAGGALAWSGDWRGRARDANGADAAANADLVSLTGTAGEVGVRLGHLNGADIRQHVADVYADWRKRGLSVEQAVERSGPFRRFCEKFGPHWLDEAAGCATAAEVPFDEYLAYLAGKYRSLFFTDDCTSFAASGTATIDGATIFHKNRDNATRAQSAYYKKFTDVPEVAGYFSTGDTSDLGLMMMVNDHGLAGSADTGGLKETRPKGRGVMNPYILRLVAERAERCEQALEIIQEMISDGWYAGGASTGTHWLFADRFGTILRVAQNNSEEQHWYHRDTVIFLARGGTPAGQTMLQKADRGKLNVADFHDAARSPDICFGSSISTLTVRIDPKASSPLETVWFGLPAWAPYLPMFSPASEIPSAIVDGRYFNAGYPLLNLRDGDAGTKFGGKLIFGDDYRQRRKEFQDALYQDALQTQERIRRLLAQADREAALHASAQGSLAAWQRYQQWNASIR